VVVDQDDELVLAVALPVRDVVSIIPHVTLPESCPVHRPRRAAAIGRPVSFR